MMSFEVTFAIVRLVWAFGIIGIGWKTFIQRKWWAPIWAGWLFGGVIVLSIMLKAHNVL